MENEPITRVGSYGEEDFYSPVATPKAGAERTQDDELESALADAPVHPVRFMQLAFEESIVESAEDQEGRKSVDSGTAEVRRQTLLESKKFDDTWQTRWNQRPTARYHPLLKLVSQIVFGMHLLQQQQAKSEGEVVKILQSHVNDVDSFLERTAEDFGLATNDIHERIRHLKLPMEHREVFEVMLDDKSFRTQLLDGNEKIEAIIEKTAKAMEASMSDLQEALKANKELGTYLDSVRDDWPRDKRVISDVFSAMRGNENGWSRYILDLQAKGMALQQALAKLRSLLGQMSQMAATASRRNASQGRVESTTSKSAPTSPRSRGKSDSGDKPPIPSQTQQSIKADNDVTRSIPHRAPLVEPPVLQRPGQQSSDSRSLKGSKTVSDEPQRPRTAGAMTNRKAREADSRSNTTADLAAFLKQDSSTSQPRSIHQNPLRSNPPDFPTNDPRVTGTRTPGTNGRSKSFGAVDVMKVAEQARGQKVVDGRDSSTSTRDSSEPIDLSGTGFARRLSKRMKHLPSQDDVNAGKPRADHADSAYASADARSIKSVKSTKSTKSAFASSNRSRQYDTLGPLPSKGMEPLYASKVMQMPVNRESGHDGTNQSVRSLAPTSKSRGSTIKNAFAKKWSSGKKLFDGSGRV